MEKTLSEKSGVLFQFATAIVLTAAAVLFPQVIHLIGKWSHSGNALGTILLPMHFAVLLSGLILGPVAGGMIGAASPLISHLLTGMPNADQVFLMCVELAVYGICTGLISKKKIAVPLKILIAQIAGRIVKLFVAALLTLALGDFALSVGSIAMTFLNGIPGMILQICLIPLLFYVLKGFTKYYE